MSKWIVLIIILIFLLSACSNPLQINKGRQRLQEQKQTQWTLHWREALHRSANDSNSFELLFYPLDSFSFSSQEGFKGKAKTIYWRGTQLHSRIEKDSFSASSISKTKTAKEQDNKSIIQHRSRKLLLWLIVCIAGIVLLALLFYRIKKCFS
jgi:type II secretory pathway pseudopilin PulG